MCSVDIYYSHTVVSLGSNYSKHNICKGEDSIKRLCADLRKHTIETMNYEKKEMSPLTK